MSCVKFELASLNFETFCQVAKLNETKVSLYTKSTLAIQYVTYYITTVIFTFRLRYPPFDKTKLKRLKWLLTPKERGRGLPWRLMILFLLVAIVAVTIQMYGVPDWIYRLRR